MTSTHSGWPVFRWSHAKVAELFSADLRSLAVYRVVLALLALADLVGRATDLTAHYTDSGVLPRIALLREIPSRASFSLHLMSGDGFVQGTLLLVAGLAALALLAGLRTRLMTVIVWVCLISIDTRNPLILNAGDVLLRMLFFWAMFLPLGACWSLDRIAVTAPRQLSMRFFSFATVGLFLQIAFVYWFTVVLKSGLEWRSDGTALYYALSIDHFVTPLGVWLYQFPVLLRIMTFGVVWFEAIGPFLLFSPIFTGPVRTGAVLAFMGLHLGIGLSMSIGAFPWISALAMVCFLPAWFWDTAVGQIRAIWPYPRGSKPRLRARVASLVRTLLSPLAAHALPALAAQQTQSSGLPAQDAGAWLWNGPARALPLWRSALHRAAPAADILESPVPHGAPDVDTGTGGGPIDSVESLRADWPLRLRSAAGTNLCAAFFLVYIFCWNLSTVSDFRIPPPLNTIGTFLHLDQSWGMFAPYPAKDDGWFVMPATLRSGKQLDLFAVTRGDFGIPEGVSWEKPRLVSRTYKNERWRKYMMNIWAKKHKNHRLYLGQYFCREWNARHDGTEVLDRFQIYYMLEPTLPDYHRAEPKKVLLWNHRCF